MPIRKLHQEIEGCVAAYAHSSIDSFGALPLTKHGHRRLMVAVDRFFEAVHIIPTHSGLAAEECGRLLYAGIYRLDGISNGIVSDRDRLFTRKLHKI